MYELKIGTRAHLRWASGWGLWHLGRSVVLKTAICKMNHKNDSFEALQFLQNNYASERAWSQPNFAQKMAKVKSIPLGFLQVPEDDALSHGQVPFLIRKCSYLNGKFWIKILQFNFQCIEETSWCSTKCNKFKLTLRKNKFWFWKFWVKKLFLSLRSVTLSLMSQISKFCGKLLEVYSSFREKFRICGLKIILKVENFSWWPWQKKSGSWFLSKSEFENREKYILVQLFGKMVFSRFQLKKETQNSELTTFLQIFIGRWRHWSKKSSCFF